MDDRPSCRRSGRNGEWTTAPGDEADGDAVGRIESDRVRTIELGLEPPRWRGTWLGLIGSGEVAENLHLAPDSDEVGAGV